MAFHLQEIYTNYGNGCRAALFSAVSQVEIEAVQVVVVDKRRHLHKQDETR